MNFIRSVGAKTLGFIQSLGSITLFLLNILAKSGTAFVRPRLSVRQVYFAGVLSVLIVAVSGLFVGMVLGLQGYTQLSKFKSADILGYMVAASLLRELGPVLAAILFASSAGGAMTSEIGLMKTTEQLEAMNVMAVNPVARVVAPRFWAGVFPCLCWRRFSTLPAFTARTWSASNGWVWTAVFSGRKCKTTLPSITTYSTA